MAMEKVLGPKARTLTAQLVDWLVMNGMEREKVTPAIERFALSLAGKKPAEEKKAEAGAGRVNEEWMAQFMTAHNGEKPLMLVQDWAALANLTRLYGADKVVARMRQFFHHADPWIKNRHDVATFVKTWNRLTGEAQKASMDVTWVKGCKHNPRCGTPVEHSNRMRDEMMAHG